MFVQNETIRVVVANDDSVLLSESDQFFVQFHAAEEKGFVAIGVNLNQNEIAPDYIMASMLKKLDSCAYHAITSVVEGTYTGENQVLGLSDGGVDVTTEKSNIQVSDSIKEQLDDLKAKVISGEIEVPYELK